MGFVSFLRDERTVLVGLGIAAVSFLCAMRVTLEYYRDEAEIKPAPPKTQYITQDTEDALKQDTLETLLQHYNFSIRETALKIVAGRAVNDPAVVDYLLWGITRPDYDERDRCLKALAFAVEDETWQEPLIALNTPKAYGALVRSLELNMEDAAWTEPMDDPLYDEYYLRDINERRCLMLLYRLMHKYGTEPLIEAGFVGRWLARQPWCAAGVDKDDDELRRRNFAAYVKRCKNRISDIAQRLAATRSGRRALVRGRLIAKSKRPRRDNNRDRPGDHVKVVLEISLADGDGEGDSIQIETTTTSSAAAAAASSASASRPRVREQSAEEQRLRRRHREAMVLNDGTHPPGHYDIIEREHDSNS